MSYRTKSLMKWVFLSIGLLFFAVVVVTLLTSGLPKTWQEGLRLVGQAFLAVVSTLAGIGEFTTWVRSLLGREATRERVPPEQLDALLKEAERHRLKGEVGRALELLRRIESVDPYYPGLAVEMAATKGELDRGYVDPETGRVVPYLVLRWARTQMSGHLRRVALLLVVLGLLTILSIPSARETCVRLARALWELVASEIVPTETPTPIATGTPTITPSLTKSVTSVLTDTPIPSSTLTPALTPTPTLTLTPTAIPVPLTPTLTPTVTPVPLTPTPTTPPPTIIMFPTTPLPTTTPRFEPSPTVLGLTTPTRTSTPTSILLPAPVLLEPQDMDPSNLQPGEGYCPGSHLTLKWEWDFRPFQANEFFDVVIWREGDNIESAHWEGNRDNQRYETRIVENEAKWFHGPGVYYWHIAVIYDTGEGVGDAKTWVLVGEMSETRRFYVRSPAECAPP